MDRSSTHLNQIDGSTLVHTHEQAAQLNYANHQEQEALVYMPSEESTSLITAYSTDQFTPFHNDDSQITQEDFTIPVMRDFVQLQDLTSMDQNLSDVPTWLLSNNYLDQKFQWPDDSTSMAAADYYNTGMVSTELDQNDINQMKDIVSLPPGAGIGEFINAERDMTEVHHTVLNELKDTECFLQEHTNFSRSFVEDESEFFNLNGAEHSILSTQNPQNQTRLDSFPKQELFPLSGQHNLNKPILSPLVNFQQDIEVQYGSKIGSSAAEHPEFSVMSSMYVNDCLSSIQVDNVSEYERVGAYTGNTLWNTNHYRPTALAKKKRVFGSTKKLRISSKNTSI
jgi:hypothetical protein